MARRGTQRRGLRKGAAAPLAAAAVALAVLWLPCESHAAERRTCWMVTYSFGTGEAALQLQKTGDADRPTYAEIVEMVNRNARDSNFGPSAVPTGIFDVSCAKQR